jgi:hypothetical protein
VIMVYKKGVFGFVELVSIILAVVFLVFAVYFMSSQMGKGEKSLADYASSRISESVKDSLRADLVDKEFAVSQTIFNIQPGYSQNFFVGVKGVGESNDFSLSVDSDWFFYNAGIVSLGSGKIEFFPVVLSVPKNVSGSFNFRLDVLKNGVLVGSEQLLVSVEDVKKI